MRTPRLMTLALGSLAFGGVCQHRSPPALAQPVLDTDQQVLRTELRAHLVVLTEEIG